MCSFYDKAKRKHHLNISWQHVTDDVVSQEIQIIRFKTVNAGRWRRIIRQKTKKQKQKMWEYKTKLYLVTINYLTHFYLFIEIFLLCWYCIFSYKMSFYLFKNEFKHLSFSVGTSVFFQLEPMQLLHIIPIP